MYRLFTKFFLSGLLLFFIYSCDAQIRFSASASPENAGLRDYITLKFTADNARAIEQINMPALRDFSIVSGPNNESGMSSVNGNVKQYIAVSYVLLPKRKGKLNLGPAVATIAGKSYRSNLVCVNISGAASATAPSQRSGGTRLQRMIAGADPFEEEPATSSFSDYVLRKNENVAAKVSANMQMRLQTNKTSVYVGEPLLAEYKLYTRLKSESSLIKNPSFNGFSVVDMMQGTGASYDRESLNGREYNVYTIRKVQLYPLREGACELEKAVMENKIQFLKYSGVNTSGNFNIDPDALVTENVSLASKPLTISVKSLPEAGRPTSFKGSVGHFNIDVSAEKNSFSSNETGKLIITIAGAGNLQLLTVPDITWPAGIEVFESKISDEIDNTTCPLAGKKIFEIPFSVAKPGSYTIPSVTFSYFDPQSESYKTLNTKAVNLNVIKGEKIVADSVPDSKNNRRGLSEIIFSNRWLIILFLAGLILTGLAVWAYKDYNQKEKKPAEGPVPDTPEILIHEAVAATRINPLLKTEACLSGEECAEFYKVLSTEMKEYLSCRYNMESTPVTARSLNAAMDIAGADFETSLKATELLRDIDQQLYMPFEKTAQMHEMYARAKTVIALVNLQRG